MKRFCLSVSLLLLALGLATAQDTDLEEAQLPLPAGLTTVPAFEDLEVVLFNNLGTYQTNQPPASLYPKGRGNSFESILQTQLGISSQNRFSAGFDLYWSNYRYGPDGGNGAFNAFGKSPESGIGAHGISQAGVKMRFIPIRSLTGLTMQVRVLFPTLPTGSIDRTLLGYDRVGAQLQASYLQLLAPKLYGYVQAEWGGQFKNQLRVQTTWSLPVQAFALYRLMREADQSLAVFGGFGRSTSFEKQYQGGLRMVNYAWYWSVGGQYQLSKALSISLGYQGALGFDAHTPISPGSFHGVNLNLRWVGTVF
jgi:hypothetical protein